MITPYKEKFSKIDHEKKMKEVEIIEGGYLDLGFTSYQITFELIEKLSGDSCTTRLTVEYEANEEVLNAYGGDVTMNAHMNVTKTINEYIENN